MATITLYRVPDADLSDGSIDELLSSDQRQEIELRRGISGRLFISTSEGEPPDWASYLSSLTKRAIVLPKHESIGAVLLLKPLANRRIIYAATWGNGHFLLRSDKVDVQGGLRCALNLMSEAEQGGNTEGARVRAVRSKRVSQNTLIMAMQASARATMDVFPLSTNTDQLRQITGRPSDTDKWGRTVTGGISIHVKRPDPDKLLARCQEMERVYRSKDYQSGYGWIDNLSPVRDKNLVDQAYEWALDELRKPTTERLNISPPSLIEWDQADTFQYQHGKKSQNVEEPSAETLSTFLREQDLLKGINVTDLREKLKLHVLDDSADRANSWPIARCISGEVTISGKTFIIDDGSVFEVSRDYLKNLNDYVSSVATWSGAPKSKNDETEATYNERLAGFLKNAILLDKKTITRPQASAIEVCDVALNHKKLIHVKRGVSSSSLSHLFAQGVVSAELIHMDDEFRVKVRARLQKGDMEGSGAGKMNDFNWLHDGNLETHACEVIYAVMTRRTAPMTVTALPFFSKVNLRMRCEELRRMGFKYSLALIPAE